MMNGFGDGGGLLVLMNMGLLGLGVSGVSGGSIGNLVGVVLCVYGGLSLLIDNVDKIWLLDWK